MSAPVDTSTANALHIAALIEEGAAFDKERFALFLRALAAERDHWRADSEAKGRALTSGVVLPEAEYLQILAERDAARAEVAALREVLLTIRDMGLGPDRGSAQWQIDTARQIATKALKGPPA